jgi:hypothetical protein
LQPYAQDYTFGAYGQRLLGLLQHFPDYYLNASEKQEGHGWLWFETRQEALDYFGITEIEKDLNIICIR